MREVSSLADEVLTSEGLYSMELVKSSTLAHDLFRPSMRRILKITQSGQSRDKVLGSHSKYLCCRTVLL
jgi:hypothetical protein